MFSQETEEKLKYLASIYPQKRSALIPMLLLAQKEHGYVKAETIEYVCKYLDLNPSEVDSIMSFYTLLRPPSGRQYHILICTNLAACCEGSDDIEACVKRNWASVSGSHFRRPVFAIEFECLGSCTTGAMPSVNGEFTRISTSPKTERLLDDLRSNRDDRIPDQLRFPICSSQDCHYFGGVMNVVGLLSWVERK
jgi:NADH-quinone oxidoreductase subunit E